MPPSHDDQKALEIIERAEEVLREVRQSQDASDRALRDMGLDPEKVRAVLAGQALTQAQRDEAESLFRKDMEDVEREVAQKADHLRSPSRGAKPGGKLPRTMV